MSIKSLLATLVVSLSLAAPVMASPLKGQKVAAFNQEAFCNQMKKFAAEVNKELPMMVDAYTRSDGIAEIR